MVPHIDLRFLGAVLSEESHLHVWCRDRRNGCTCSAKHFEGIQSVFLFGLIQAERSGFAEVSLFNLSLQYEFSLEVKVAIKVAISVNEAFPKYFTTVLDTG